jgi:Fe-S-cluster containining protein
MLTRQEFFARARKGKTSTEQLYSAYDAYSTCPKLGDDGEFRCSRCGECCRRPWRVEASVYDVQRWIWESRLDIIGKLEYIPKKGPPPGLTECEKRSLEMMCSELIEYDESLVAMLAFALASARDSALVVSKNNGECVFHHGSGCDIYSTRPDVCVKFPDTSLFEGFTTLLE